MPRPPSRAVPFVLAACALALAAPARAGDVQTLKLRDGTTVTGKIVEYVAGDNVVVEIAPGERTRIDWSTLAIAARAPRIETDAPAPAPLPPGPGGEEQPEPALAAPSGPGRRISLGAMTGFPAPLGYLALVADGFPFRMPVLRAIGLELAVAMPIAGEPVTLGESLLFELPRSGRVGLGFGAGFAQSFVKPVLPSDHGGVVNTAMFDLTHLTVDFIPQLSMRAGWGWALFINGSYCKPHPEACPQLASAGELLSFYGHFALLWTFDFDRVPR